MSVQGQVQTQPRAVWGGSVPHPAPISAPTGMHPKWSGDTGHRREESLCHLGPRAGTKEQGQRSRNKHFPHLLCLQIKEKQSLYLQTHFLLPDQLPPRPPS